MKVRMEWFFVPFGESEQRSETCGNRTFALPNPIIRNQTA